MKAKRGSVTGEATKIALLDAAQELFATQGIDGVSLRAIQRMASVAPGTLQYHFGSREELLEALLAREHAGINQKTSDLAARLLQDEQVPDARAIIAIVVQPYADLLKADPVRGPGYVKVIAQLARDDQRIAPLAGDLKTLIPAVIKRAYPGATTAIATTANVIAMRSLLFLLAGRVVDAAARAPENEAEEIETIVTFVAAGFDAVLRKAIERRAGAKAKRPTKVAGAD